MATGLTRITRPIPTIGDIPATSPPASSRPASHLAVLTRLAAGRAAAIGAAADIGAAAASIGAAAASTSIAAPASNTGSIIRRIARVRVTTIRACSRSLAPASARPAADRVSVRARDWVKARTGLALPTAPRASIAAGREPAIAPATGKPSVETARRPDAPRGQAALRHGQLHARPAYATAELDDLQAAAIAPHSAVVAVVSAAVAVVDSVAAVAVGSAVA